MTIPMYSQVSRRSLTHPPRRSCLARCIGAIAPWWLVITTACLFLASISLILVPSAMLSSHALPWRSRFALGIYALVHLLCCSTAVVTFFLLECRGLHKSASETFEHDIQHLSRAYDATVPSAGSSSQQQSSELENGVGDQEQQAGVEPPVWSVSPVATAGMHVEGVSARESVCDVLCD